jgi:hypothetical protein
MTADVSRRIVELPPLGGRPSTQSQYEGHDGGDGRYDRSKGHKRTVVLPVSNVLGWRGRRGKGKRRWQTPRSRPSPTRLS